MSGRKGAYVIYGSQTSRNIAPFLKVFGSLLFWSGQKVNSFKSSIFFNDNTKPWTIHSVQEIFNLKKLQRLILLNRFKKKSFEDLISIVNQRINGWKAKFFSQADHTTIIKSIAVALPSYSMSSFLLSKSMCKTLDTASKIYGEGFKTGKSKNLILKSWRSICQPTYQGSVGLHLM